MASKSKDVKVTPAGIHDDFKIAGIDMQEIFNKDERYVSDAKGKVKVESLSTELMQGMSIKAYDGGKEIETER